MVDNAKLTIEIKNTQPLELVELAQSFQSFADEYRRYLLREEESTVADDIKLYVKEIKSGSVITDLVAMSACALPFAENANSIVGFGQYLKGAFDFLTGKSGKKTEFEKANYENLSKFVEPIAKDNASQVNCSTVINGDIHLTLNISSTDANAAQNVASREIAKLKEPSTGIKEKVVLYWNQTRNDPSSNLGDRAIIESIHNGPVKTTFAKPEGKAKLLMEPDNFFIHAYVVDVAIETIREKPVLYKIIEVHDKIEINNQP